MYNQTHVVIGANYGDEGKGLVTDYLCMNTTDGSSVTDNPDQPRILNIRHNGGAQAGHSVYWNGRKHVFGHFGAGSFHPNVDTWLTRDYIVNPLLFIKELMTLRSVSQSKFNVYISDDCIVTTPFDIMRNQIAASLASTIDSTHTDTVGVGIFETVKRNRDSLYKLVVGDFRYHRNDLNTTAVLHAIAEDTYSWYEDTMAREVQNGLKLPSGWKPQFSRQCGSSMIANFMKTMRDFLCITHSDKQLNHRYANVVMEGAQGLALSQSNMYTRDGKLASDLYALTPSFTGMENVVNLINDELTSPEKNMSTIDTRVHLHYVTRAYFTRHGRGAFPSELSNDRIPLEWTIRDSTNRYHEYQGVIRIGNFHSGEMFRRIKEDLTKISSDQIFSITLHVNFLDQTGDKLYDVCAAVDDSESWTLDGTCVVIPKEKVREYLIGIAQRRHEITLDDVVFHDTSVFEPQISVRW